MIRRFILLTAICQLSALVIQPAEAEEAVVQQYLETAQIREASLRGVQMAVEIGAALPNLEKASSLSALRRISCGGQVTYTVLASVGDLRVKREIINRYLAAESHARDAGGVSITPANYEFRLRSTFGPEGQRVHVFRIKPKRKRVGLFKGELWLDETTGMPLREDGQFVKVPSIFLKSIRFVRTYEIRDGVSIPKSIESTLETRLMGRVELSVHFHNLTYENSGHCGSRDPAVLYGGVNENTQ
jgi:hypothetical protein